VVFIQSIPNYANRLTPSNTPPLTFPGIAHELALAGATVYATARSTAPADCTEQELGGTLADLAREVEALSTGGTIVPVKCDHARDDEVYAVLERIRREQGGRLDVLVNNAFQVAPLETMTGKAFWEQGAAVWDPLMQVGLRSHYIAACAGAPLLIETAAANKQPPVPPAIINVGSFGGVSYVFNTAYGVGKAAVDRLSKDMAVELRPNGVASFSLWPGGLWFGCI
jgi:NAD(P)-dependent dehydrogenase (short-subunit alcohol dehydrogenase family)